MSNEKLNTELEPVMAVLVKVSAVGSTHATPADDYVLFSDAASVIAKLERKVDYWRDLAKEKEKQLAAKDAEIAKFESLGLTVWFGSMPESCGRENWTVMLSRKSAQDGAEESVVDSLLTGVTVCRSEYKDRMRYEADRLRFLIGEIDKEPWILDYDADLHSGYQYPPSKEVANLREQLAKLTQELETERMRLAACGVVAMANTPESAVEAREMHPDYMSASCQDVMRAVDAEMKYREQLAAAEKDAARYRYLRNCTVTDGDVDESLYVSVDSDDWPNRWALFGGDLDKAIDAAMKGEEA